MVTDGEVAVRGEGVEEELDAGRADRSIILVVPRERGQIGRGASGCVVWRRRGRCRRSEVQLRGVGAVPWVGSERGMRGVQRLEAAKG